MKKVIPVVDRIVNGDENAWANFLNKEKETNDIWERFGKNVLVISDNIHIWQCAEEYPFVRYECSKTSSDFLPSSYLNSFVKRISVSVVKDCRKFTLGVGEFVSESVDSEVVVYYEDNFGECHMIFQKELYDFLRNTPKLVVSPEGVLVFYTTKEIIATMDCNHYIYVNLEMDDDEVIHDIAVHFNNSLKIILRNYTTNEQRNPFLKFEFSLVSKIPFSATLLDYKWIGRTTISEENS